MIEMRSATTAIIVIIIRVLDDIGGAVERLPNAIILVVGSSAAVAHRSHVLVELVGVEVRLIPHHLLEGLDRAQLPEPNLVLPSAPVHHQMRIVVEDYGRNNIIAA